jgi:hypothetical protein
VERSGVPIDRFAPAARPGEPGRGPRTGRRPDPAPSVGFVVGARAFIPGRGGLRNRPTLGNTVPPGGAEATLRSWSHDPFPRERRGCEAADRLATLLPWASDEKGRIGPPDRSTPAGLR